jgi:tRNA/rRNA methyltransferase
MGGLGRWFRKPADHGGRRQWTTPPFSRILPRMRTALPPPAPTEPDAMPPSVAVILLRTHSPGNLGSAARAVANFGARLVLVDPRVSLDHPDVAAHSSGAEHFVVSARSHCSLADASEHHDHLVALTSARGRRFSGLPPRTTATALRRRVASGQRVALVFGPERSGLLTDEVLRCDSRWSLPTEPSFPTMNLAQAVAVALALLRYPASRVGAPLTRELPDGSTSRKLFAEARRVLEVRFPERRSRPDVVDELLSLLRRAQLTRREAELLLAALSVGRKQAD